MRKNIYKYCFKVFSLVLLLSFLNSSLGICGIVANNCKSENTSCCCKNHQNNDSSHLTLEKKCCCEVKEMTTQPAAISPGLNESSLKNIVPASNVYSFIAFDDSGFISNINVLTFHSPPNKKIHILNSNFRI